MDLQLIKPSERLINTLEELIFPVCEGFEPTTLRLLVCTANRSVNAAAIQITTL